jgi:hypothetical protein
LKINPHFFDKLKADKSGKSAEWCIQALDQCWEKKEPNIRSKEKPSARAAYDRARKVYENIVKETGASKN